MQNVQTKELLSFLRNKPQLKAQEKNTLSFKPLLGTRNTVQIRTTNSEVPVDSQFSEIDQLSLIESFNDNNNNINDNNNNIVRENNNLITSMFLSPEQSLRETLSKLSWSISSGSSGYTCARSLVNTMSIRITTHRDKSYLGDVETNFSNNFSDSDEEIEVFSMEGDSGNIAKMIFNIPSFHIAWRDDLSSEDDVNNYFFLFILI